MERDEHAARATVDAGMDAIRRGFARVVGEPEPVDLHPFLLEPPQTPEQAARRARQRLLVRCVSLVLAAAMAAVLLLPAPGGADPAPAGGDTDEPLPAAAAVVPAPEPAPTTHAVWLDAPPARVRRARATAEPRQTRRPRRTMESSGPASPVAPAPAAAADPPATVHRPDPVSHAPRDAGVLVPVL